MRACRGGTWVEPLTPAPQLSTVIVQCHAVVQRHPQVSERTWSSQLWLGLLLSKESRRCYFLCDTWHTTAVCGRLSKSSALMMSTTCCHAIVPNSLYSGTPVLPKMSHWTGSPFGQQPVILNANAHYSEGPLFRKYSLCSC